MRFVIKAVKWAVSIFLLALTIAIIYFGSIESYVYFTRSEAMAQVAAEAMFVELCREYGLDPQSFHGPERPGGQTGDKLNQYNFIWTRQPEEEITVDIMYWPSQAPYTMSEGILLKKSALH